MAIIVTRDGKGSALTHTEADANFTNLNSELTSATSAVADKLAKASNLSDLTDAGAARTNLGLGTAATTAATDYATAAQGSLADSAVQAETNDLTAAVTWANVPDANITQSSVTQHSAALSITESQISDLGTYLTGVALNDVSDVTITTVGTGEVLQYNGSAWVNATPAAAGIELTDLSVGTEGAASGDGAIAYNNTSGVFTFTPADISTKLSLTGGTMSGNIAMGSNTISGLADPLSLQDAATKAYVDGQTAASVAVTDLTDVDTTGIADGKILKYSTASSKWLIADDSGAGGGISNVVEDLTPQLGGDLDTAGNSIVSSVGSVKFADSILFRNTTGNNFLLESDSTGFGNILRAPSGMSANLALTLPAVDGTVGQVLQTNGSGVLSFVTASGGGGGLANIVEDLTPQLGANLDVNGFDLTNGTASIRGSAQLFGSSERAVLDSRIGTGTDSVHRSIGTFLNNNNQALAIDGQKGYVVDVIKSNMFKFNSPNVTNNSSSARFRLNTNYTIIDGNGSNYGSNSSGRGIVGSYQYMEVYGTNPTYPTTFARVTGQEMLVYSTPGYDTDFNNVTTEDITIGTMMGQSIQLRDDPASGVATNITSEMVLLNVKADSSFVFQGGAKAYGFRNETSWLLEKFGSIEKYTEHAHEAAVSGAVAVDFNNGNVQMLTLTGAVTSFTMNNFPTTNLKSGNNELGTLKLFLLQDGTGGHTVSYSAGSGETFKISGGVTTTDTGAGNITVVEVLKINGIYLWKITGNYS